MDGLELVVQVLGPKRPHMHHPTFRLPTKTPPFIRGAVLTAMLWLAQPREARAEDSVTYKFQSWQEDNQRIRVDASYLLAEKDLGPDMHLKAMGVLDSIAGATPTGETPRTPGGEVPLAHMEDTRRAWDVSLSRQFSRVAATVGYAVSRESDYLSRVWSVNTVTDFNQKNTSLLLGYGRTNDRIMEPKLGWTIDRHKKGNDFITGLNQILDANTSLTANVSWGRSRGFMADPYKIVSTTKLDLDPGFYYTPPENRPGTKNKLSAFLGVNRNFAERHAALEASYRWYQDGFGISSHTVALAWVQELGKNWVVEPSLRYARQSAADFYSFDLDRAGVITTYDLPLGETGTGRAPFYSSDYRLSRMETIDAGVKVSWKVRPWMQLDAAYNRYVARGLDGVTPQDAYSRAHCFTVGVKLSR